MDALGDLIQIAVVAPSSAVVALIVAVRLYAKRIDNLEKRIDELDRRCQRIEKILMYLCAQINGEDICRAVIDFG